MDGTGHVASMRKSTDILVGKPEGKRPLSKSRRRWENIEMYLQEGGWGLHWNYLAHDRDRWLTL